MADSRVNLRPRKDLTVRLLVRLHPAEFRQRFGSDIVEAYRYGLDQRTGAVPQIRYWLAALVDLGIGVFLVRLSRLRSLIGRRGLLTVPAAGSGTLVGGVCSVAVCCPTHAALLGPIGLTGATIATAMQPMQPIVLAASAIVVLLAWTMMGESASRHVKSSPLLKQLSILGATTVFVFAVSIPVLRSLT